MVKIKSKITGRGIQVSLGLLWLLDGALQLQHQMFSSNFATQVIVPAAQGQPGVVSGVMNLAVRIFLLHPALFNSFIAIIQLGLGLLILCKRTVKLGLTLSALWGVFVWYVGEGAGGLLSGHTLLLMGAPGAALLYALLGLSVMPKNDKSKNPKPIHAPAYWLAFVWAGLWVGGAIYQLLPGQNSVSDLSSMIAGNASVAPGWLAALDIHVGGVINNFGAPTTSMTGMHMSAYQMAQMQTQAGSGYWFILLLAALQLLIGVAIFLPRRFRSLALGLGSILSLGFWFVGQSLGGYFTGLATDPNTGPLFVLLAIAIFGCSELDTRLRKLGKRLERALI